MQISVSEVIRHAKNHWSLYASEVRGRMLCRIWFNGTSEYKVTHGVAGSGQEDPSIYQGCDLFRAVNVYNNL